MTKLHKNPAITGYEFIKISTLLLYVYLGAAMSSAQAPKSFSIVSIKKTTGGCSASQIRPMEDGLRVSCLPVSFLIQQAYGFSDKSRIIKAPEWTSSDFYDIDAKVDAAEIEAYKSVTLNERNAMLQKVLEDRFKLKFHRENREMPSYVLTIAKNGPKLHEPTYAADQARPTPYMRLIGRNKIEARNSNLTFLSVLLAQELGRPVVDHTELKGSYDFTLSWASENSANPQTTASEGGPSLFTAVQEQLGLKLDPAHVPQEVLVIDSIEVPSLN